MATIIISTTQNDDYLFYLPIVVKSWNELGYDVFLYYVGVEHDKRFQTAKKYISNGFSYYILNIEGIRPETVAQVSRLYAAYHFKEDILITSDIDMIVKKNIFETHKGIHTYGHDLTNFEHVPMCYIQMDAPRWRELMKINLSEPIEKNIVNGINEEPLSKSPIKYGGWWCIDQEIITKKIKATPFVYSHHRGMMNGLPIGRLDRSGWVMPQEIIDIHLPKEPLKNLDKIIPVTYEWVKDYANDYVASTR